MENKKYWMIALSVVVCIVFGLLALSAFDLWVFADDPVETETSVEEAPDDIQTQEQEQVNLGPVWTPAPEFETENTGLVDWDHLTLTGEWVESVGLSGCDVLYMQSGVPNTLARDGEVFFIDEDSSLIFGAFSATLDLEGESYSFSNGFYAGLGSGTAIDKLSITDGFVLMVANSCAEQEFCYRVSQAIEEKWAYEHVFHGMGWEPIVCEGIYSVPLDSDR